MSRDDAREIADRLNDDIESVCSKFWPGWIRVKEKGQDVGLMTPRIKLATSKTAKTKKLTSSFKVELSGSHKGRWFRFSQSVGGYGLALLYYGHTDRIPNSKEEFREAFQFAREHLGMTEERSETPEDKAAREDRRAREQDERAKKQKAEAERAERKREYRAQTAKVICDQMMSIKGTLAENYLIERGIAPVCEWPWNPDGILGFIADHEYEREAEWDHGNKIKEGRRFPALIARVQDVFGETISCWQIFLHPTEPRKNDLVDEAKVGCGSPVGGAVRLGGISSHIGAAEGLESALGAWELERYRYPVWSMLSTGGIASFEPPLQIERITGWPDGDKAVLSPSGKVMEPPGISHQRQLRERMLSAGIKMTINEMARDADPLDLLATKKKFEKRIGEKNGEAANPAP